MSASNFDAQTEKLWQAWQDMQAQADEALKKGAAHYFTCIRKTVCSALALEALASARLGKSDEGVFDHLVYIMEAYREVISLFDGHIKNTSPDLVEGLCDILTSRLRQFEDDATGPGNPVALEKYAILESAIINTARQIEDLENSYILDSLSPAGANCICEPSAATQLLCDAILDNNLPALHAIFTQNLQTCLSNIDDLHARKTASYYTDLLEREWEVLGLIIQVQVRAIEAAFEAAHESDPDAAPETHENTAKYSMYNILSKLREAYQQTGPIVSGLRKMMQAATQPRTAPGSGYEDFARTLATGMTPPPPMCIDSQALTAALLPEADAKFESLRTSNLELINNLQTAAANEISLAKEVVAVFEKAVAGLIMIKDESTAVNLAEEAVDITGASATQCDDIAPETEESPMQAEIPGSPHESPKPDSLPACNADNEILNGIAETLEIKVESLTESLQFFSENSTNLMSSIATGLPVLSEENLTAAAGQMQAAWCAAPPATEEIADFLAECISLDAFASYAGQFAKHIEASSAKIQKASFRFKKETLLYEISTYEEILYHSVSRLRESPLPHIAAAVSLLDETFSALETLLTNNGITVIRPAPHEPFNGREHEVLLAEEAEGFAKGGIIKVMTSGYKFEDQVILRANVIAAR